MGCRRSDVLTCNSQNKMKINDWSSIQTLFDELNKRLDKIHKTPGSTAGEPRKYIKMLVELEVGGISGDHLRLSPAAWHAIFVGP